MPTTVKYPEPEPLDESEKETEPDPITHRLNEMAEGIEKRAEEREERMGQGFARMLFDHAKEIETTIEEGSEKVKEMAKDIGEIQAEVDEAGAVSPDSGGGAGSGAVTTPPTGVNPGTAFELVQVRYNDTGTDYKLEYRTRPLTAGADGSLGFGAWASWVTINTAVAET